MALNSLDLDTLDLLSEGDIDFSTLSEDALSHLVWSEDCFVATAALSELSRQRKKNAPTLAWKILIEKSGDIYLQASALEVLFKFDADRAIEYISENIASVEHYMFGSIMEILLENSELFHQKKNVRLVELASRRLATILAHKSCIEEELVGRFNAAFELDILYSA
jgi:hypothetical protein